VTLHERRELGHGPLAGNRIGVGEHDGVAGRRGDTGVRVGRVSARARALEEARVRRQPTGRPGNVGDHEHFLDLRRERGERPLEQVRLTMGDDNRGDPHCLASRTS
jgi:hypothetical protein